MVRSIGELELERGSEPAPAPFTVCEKKLEIIGCLNPALFLGGLCSGCRIVTSDDLHGTTVGSHGEGIEGIERRVAIHGGTVARQWLHVPRDAGNWSLRKARSVLSLT